MSDASERVAQIVDADPCGDCGHPRGDHAVGWNRRVGTGPCGGCGCSAYRATPVATGHLPPDRIRAVAAHLREGYPPDGAWPVELFLPRGAAAAVADLLDELAEIREARGRS